MVGAIALWCAACSVPELPKDLAQENEAWLRALGEAYRNDEAPMPTLDQSDLIEDLSYGAVRGAAQYYLDTERYVQVVLLPEGE